MIRERDKTEVVTTTARVNLRKREERDAYDMLVSIVLLIGDRLTL